MAYDPQTGAWKYDTSDTTGDSVEGRVKGLVDVNSPIIQQARTQGMESANRRGLINSSIAVGASEDAAYKAAVPIATADASLVGQKNLSAQGAEQSLVQGQQTIQGQKDIQTQQDAATNARLVEQLGSQERVAAAQDAAAKERLGLQLTSQEKQNADALKNALTISTNTIAGNAANTAATIQGNKDISKDTIAANAANTDKTINAQTAQWVVTATTNARTNANSVINNITANPNIPADQRQAYIDQAEANYAADVKVIANIGNVQIPYTEPVVPGSAAADPLNPNNQDTPKV